MINLLKFFSYLKKYYLITLLSRKLLDLLKYNFYLYFLNLKKLILKNEMYLN